MKVCLKKVSAFAVALFVLLSSLVVPTYATGISFDEGGVFGTVVSWLGGSAAFDWIWGTDHSGQYAANKPHAYYTTPTESVEDQYGNVINYYRGGDTTTTKIIDSYNHTFNTIHNTTNNNTTNNTNNYSANVKLQDFLNTYTTNNNNYTYNTEYKSWYYDNTSNTYQFDNSQTYYNTDNSRYYISIDNSTDEYYLVDVQYSPTFVTVNYTYNTTNNNYNNNYGDVTNVYYFELTDGRNSSTLTADEVAGLDLGYDVANYELVTDDPNTLSLQHFDGDYTDSSSYGRTFYSVNRSTNYVDSGAFGKAVKLSSGSAAGVTISGLSGYDGLSFDFRIYYDNPSSLGVYIGDTNIFQEVVKERSWECTTYYADHNTVVPDEEYNIKFDKSIDLSPNKWYEIDWLINYYYGNSVDDSRYQFQLIDDVVRNDPHPTSYLSGGFSDESSYLKKYGWMSFSSSKPSLDSEKHFYGYLPSERCEQSSIFSGNWVTRGWINHYDYYEYSWKPLSYILADFAYSSYVSQWLSMRITIDDGKLYYFVNGDFVGSGAFTMPITDQFYIKSSGTLYLDELRVSAGDMVSTEVYTPSSEPYDTNKVLALPSVLTANTIYTRHSTPVSAWRVGGVRPSNPSTGFLYIPLYDDYTGGQAQFYDGANWVDVEAMVYDGSTTKSVKGFQFTPMGASSDVDSDLKEPDGSDDDSGGSCSHEWEETSRTDATCSLMGSVSYTCSKCDGTKTEMLSKLSHNWEVKQSVQTSYDESGNILTEGFTIYRCTVCGEEYKDSSGSGPPSVSDDEDDTDGFLGWLGEKLGDLFGALGDGIISLLEATLGKILDSLISLVETVFERLSKIVNLFGGFGEALGILWTWLPEDIVVVLVAGVTVFVFLGVIKLFFK